VNLQQKYNSLKDSLKKLGKVVVAYSGGVDSTFLLKAAVDTLGTENVLACTGISASLAESQHKTALQCAEMIGANLREVAVHEVSDTQYSANQADRCFHCKSHLYQILTDIAKDQNFNAVVCGSNLDDKDDFRPGNKAADVFGIRTPLMQAGLTKKDIRKLSRELNLPTADLPASPCLASRIAYGLQITEDRLKQIEQAEEFLRSLGLIEFRVRHHDELARIEVIPSDFEKVTQEPNRSAIAKKLKSLGFKFVAVDLTGFKSGSLNVTLTEEQKNKSLQ